MNISRSPSRSPIQASLRLNRTGRSSPRPHNHAQLRNRSRTARLRLRGPFSRLRPRRVQVSKRSRTVRPYLRVSYLVHNRSRLGLFNLSLNRAHPRKHNRTGRSSLPGRSLACSQTGQSSRQRRRRAQLRRSPRGARHRLQRVRPANRSRPTKRRPRKKSSVSPINTNAGVHVPKSQS